MGAERRLRIRSRALLGWAVAVFVAPRFELEAVLQFGDRKLLKQVRLHMIQFGILLFHLLSFFFIRLDDSRKVAF
jgi:hypothetical protein